ncbi:hypothetical protein [Oceaniglobus trochenteri]|uniref:hypothetical protein n=1 Tax=Oceaniglobus trochenteri TaxID=2763260 RepID=UPI001CFF5C31|nr:hypothetical protein [Oceaniglobus trochenteri]
MRIDERTRPGKAALAAGALALVLLGSCGTPEYRAERTQCKAEWMLKIPPVFREEVVTRYRSEKRPTGETRCETTGATTLCQPVIGTVSVPYTAFETVDIRKGQREAQIAACAARACSVRYGNATCEP